MKKILAVDDHDANAKLVQVILELYGYRVTCAYNVREAFRVIHHELPDLIVMDLRLPGISGWECIQMLKSHPETRHIPIIAVTASGHVETDKCQGTPYDALIIKPYSPDQLVQYVNRLVQPASV